MRYEKKSEPLASPRVFFRRVARHFFLASVFFVITLIIGTTGYHYSTHPRAGWLDAFHNSSMILSGMGPVIPEEQFTPGGKVFSSLYALFSGIIFVGAMGFALAPGIHRLFHKLHIEEN